MNTVIVNAKIVNEGQIVEGDLSVEGERIKGINVSHPSNPKIIDARGAWLIPGMIDDQVHFREPGFEHKGTIETESRAAVAGGITSYMEMPNCNPLTVNEEALIDKRNRAAKVSSANYGFYLGATNDNIEDVKSINPRLTCGVKVFMGASTGNMLVDAPKILEMIFSSTPLLVATHCEDTPTIREQESLALEKWGEDIPMREHPNIRSEEACYLSSSFAVGLAKKHGTKLHVLHLTTAREMELFEAGPIEEKKITAEACVHHLFFSDSDYEERGTFIKCNPAIKSKEDRDAIVQAVNEDRIDVIATDHAPHTLEEKHNNYLRAPSGMPLAQDSLVSLFDKVNSGIFAVEKVVEKTSHAPAKLYEVSERGFLREGYYADLVLISPSNKKSDREIFSKCGWSPFSGHHFANEVSATWVNGSLRYENGKILSGPCGKAMEYKR